ncbi:hypothetical protein LCGC14_1008210, partial [marine sediment metagenome]
INIQPNCWDYVTRHKKLQIYQKIETPEINCHPIPFQVAPPGVQ